MGMRHVHHLCCPGMRHVGRVSLAHQIRPRLQTESKDFGDTVSTCSKLSQERFIHLDCF